MIIRQTRMDMGNAVMLASVDAAVLRKSSQR